VKFYEFVEGLIQHKVIIDLYDDIVTCRLLEIGDDYAALKEEDSGDEWLVRLDDIKKVVHLVHQCQECILDGYGNQMSEDNWMENR